MCTKGESYDVKLLKSPKSCSVISTYEVQLTNSLVSSGNPQDMPSWEVLPGTVRNSYSLSGWNV